MGDLTQCRVAAPPGPEPMGGSGERRFVVRLEQQTHDLTDDLVAPGRHAQRTPAPVLFRDVHASCRGETVTLVAHRIDDAFDFTRGHAIHCLLSVSYTHLRAHETVLDLV